MDFLLAYSFPKVVSAKRALSVFQDFAVTPAAAMKIIRLKAIFLGVMRTETVAIAVSTRTTAIITTPAREIVRISPTHPTASAKAQRALSSFGIRAASAAAI